ncbi:MAG TPA: LamG domain-containing protein [Rectinemataceae bacterium]
MKRIVLSVALVFALAAMAGALPPPTAHLSFDQAGSLVRESIGGQAFPLPPSISIKPGGVSGSYLALKRQDDAFVRLGKGYGYSGDFSISFWFRTAPGYRDTGAIFLGRHMAGGFNGYWFMINAEWGYGAQDKLCFYYSNATAVSKTSLNDGRWHHVAAVHKRSEGAYLYIDGVLEAKGPPAQMVVPDVDFILGGIGWNPPRGAFSGDLDEISIFDLALEAPDVSLLAKNPGALGTSGAKAGSMRISLKDGQVIVLPLSDIAGIAFGD